MKARQCPCCHGAGGWKDVILDDGSGPIEPCGYCNGTGEIKNKRLFYQILAWEGWDKRRKKK